MVRTAFVRRSLRAARCAAKDKRIPAPLRWFAALGLLPVPGPFDEAVLLLVAIPLALFHRAPLHEAWQRAGDAPPTGARRRASPSDGQGSPPAR